MRSKVSSDPEHFLQIIDEIYSDFSDDEDFEGYLESKKTYKRILYSNYNPS